MGIGLMNRTEMIKLSSVPLHSIVGSECVPVGIASGCIVKYPRNDYLITVFHAILKKEGTWAVLSEWKAEKGTIYIKLGKFTFQKLLKIDGTSNQELELIIEDIDFAFTTYPKDIDNFYQEIGYDKKIKLNEKRLKFDHTKLVSPNTKSVYGFSGQIMPVIIEGVAIESENMIYKDLKYLKTVGNFHHFKLPFEHPGHEYFRGCSGAPILDESGNIVSLLCCSAEEKDG